MVNLILVRHGQSQANEENIYTGWTDSPLTLEGENQAIKAGLKIKKDFLKQIDGYHTSVLSRAIKTAYLIQEQLNDLYKPIQKNWRLNERHYGALRGLNKDDTRKTYGAKQVAIWRRSYDVRPPELEQADATTGRYKYLNPRSMPVSESLKDATDRVIPYYLDKVIPELLDGKNQMIVAHGSTIRALVKYIENISDEDIDGVEIENAAPIIYEFDERLNLRNKKD